MLHNSDPFGTSEAPLNMGASVNMTANGPMNIANGFNNLSKSSHEASQSVNTHYNLSNYSSYGHSIMSSHSAMHPFQNFQSNVFQTSFVGHNSPALQETSWQHGLLPMNLNTQVEDSPHVNFYDRKDFSINDYSYTRSAPLNIPQVYTKAYHKEAALPQNYPNYHSTSSIRQSEHNLDLSMNKTHKPQARQYDLDLTTKTHTMDETRRRSLENTVKMIENILIHNPTNSNKYPQVPHSKPETAKVQAIPVNDTPKTQTEEITKPSDHKEENINSVLENCKIEDNTKSTFSCSTENSVESETNSDERNNNVTTTFENENESSNNDSLENHIEQIEIKVEPHPNDSESDSEDVKPLITFDTVKNPLETYTEVSQSDNGIEVKVEQLSSWVDLEHSIPFQRDIFGVVQVPPSGVIVEAHVSVITAKESFKKGEKVAPNSNYYECPNCNLYISHPKRFLIHTKWHSFGLTNEKRMEVKEEQKRIREMRRNMRKEARQLVKMNMEEIKGGTVAPEAFNCNACEKVFCTRSSLKNHKLRYHQNRLRECRICYKSIMGYVAWRAHLKTHSSDSRYQCTECPKRFKYSHSLVKHKDTHLEKTLSCEQCPKMFGSKALLNTHMKTHERHERGMTFHCSYCGKGFFESYNLQVHERTHRNERPFLCEICNTSFGTNSSLQRHLKVSHNSSKPYQCSTCHRNFISEMIRDRHVLRHHGEPEQFKFLCSLCPCRYLNQKDLNKHIQKNHPRPGRKKRGRKNEDDE